MLEFEYTGLPSHVVFGPGAARGSRLVDAVDALHARRRLLVATYADGRLAAAQVSAR